MIKLLKLSYSKKYKKFKKMLKKNKVEGMKITDSQQNKFVFHSIIRKKFFFDLSALMTKAVCIVYILHFFLSLFFLYLLLTTVFDFFIHVFLEQMKEQSYTTAQ